MINNALHINIYIYISIYILQMVWHTDRRTRLIEQERHQAAISRRGPSYLALDHEVGPQDHRPSWP